MKENYNKVENSVLENLLNIAVRQGNAEVTRFILKQGINPNIQNEDDESILFIAAKKSYTEIVEIILQYGGDIEFQIRGLNPLLIAIQNKDFNTTKKLLEYGANYSIETASGVSALNLAASLKDIDIITVLLEYMENKIEEQTLSFKELLKLIIDAINEGNFSNLTKLIESYDARKIISEQPILLNLAASKGNHKILKLLLENGADANGESNRTTALHIASYQGFTEITKALLAARANIEKELSKCTPLCLAIKAEHTKTIELLTEHGAKVMYGNTNLLKILYKTQNHKIIDAVLKNYLNEVAEINYLQNVSDTKNSFEVVVVRYKEDVSWIASEFPQTKVTVYNKGEDELDLPPNCNVIKLPNIGYLGGTYLYHIVNNYNNLPNRTLFLQGYPYDVDLLELPLNKYKYNSPEFNCKNIIGKCWLTSLNRADIELSQKDWNNSKYNKFIDNNSTLIDFTHESICNHPVNAPLYVNYGGEFAVEKEKILSRSLKFYQDMLPLFNNQYPMIDHFFERTADLWFSDCKKYL